jgi:hypothetical protein
MEERFLTRSEVLDEGFLYPEKEITLIPTKHFWDRLEERGSLLYFPNPVQVTRENIHSGKTRDGKTLHSVVIRLDYGSKCIYLCFNPYDSGLKSVCFNDKFVKKE